MKLFRNVMLVLFCVGFNTSALGNILTLAFMNTYGSTIKTVDITIGEEVCISSQDLPAYFDEGGEGTVATVAPSDDGNCEFTTSMIPFSFSVEHRGCADSICKIADLSFIANEGTWNLENNTVYQNVPHNSVKVDVIKSEEEPNTYTIEVTTSRNQQDNQ